MQTHVYVLHVSSFLISLCFTYDIFADEFLRNGTIIVLFGLHKISVESNLFKYQVISYGSPILFSTIVNHDSYRIVASIDRCHRLSFVRTIDYYK
jgi:hypothetical protein